MPHINTRRLNELPLTRSYRRALRELSGVEVLLREKDEWPPARRGEDCRNAFCELMVRSGRTCTACRRVEGKLSSGVLDQPLNVTCLAGLVQSAVPVMLDGELLGFVETEPLRLKKPQREQFERTVKLLEQWHLKFDGSKLARCYFQAPQLTPAEHRALVALMALFSESLSILAEQLMFASDEQEPPQIARARKLIEEHRTEKLSLSQVARAVGVSPSYFSRIFKKVTTFRFTDYLARVRVEQARQMLRKNRDLRISEIAFAVGFDSIPHFNRVFKKIVGQSPGEYRRGGKPSSQ